MMQGQGGKSDTLNKRLKKLFRGIPKIKLILHLGRKITKLTKSTLSQLNKILGLNWIYIKLKVTLV